MRRDGTLVRYERKFKSGDYPHLAGDEAYTDDGYYRRSRTEDSWDIVKIFPINPGKKSTPEIDLNTCVPGQKLQLRNGDIVEYERKRDCYSIYPHKVNGEEYTNDGCYLYGRVDSWDVVKILPVKKSTPEIDLNTCVPGQKVKLRDETIGTYNGLIDENTIYTHAVDGYSYISNGRFWMEDGRTSTKDVVEILPLEKESKPVTDLRTCVPGQKVRLRSGKSVTYQRATDSTKYPHRLSNGLTYSDEGCYWFDKRRSDYDAVEILPLEEEPVKTTPELMHSITDQIDVTSPDHVSIIPQSNGVLISIKKGLTTISWRHYNS